MASTSAPRTNAGYGRIKSAATALYSDNQTLISEIRKATLMMKEIAVDFERDNKSDMVKELEDSVLELLRASDDCTHLSTAIKSIGDEYHPGNELTNFSKLLDDKLERLKPDSSSAPENHHWLRQFREAIWNVHHAGQPMPGEEQEDIVMTSTENNLRNTKCPLTGKPITELAEPVRSVDCKHIYDKNAILRHMRVDIACPVAGVLFAFHPI
ncbi:RING/U-box superfamily protein [Striga asiatica]|uniref:RING/U-box superfamily protein n=1 Tax=Striga asiatica TaxID=4170 RepID=A0A5A7QDI5_STRAF|nr:RING/U-box superfamily protein [Striga asiatica]